MVSSRSVHNGAGLGTEIQIEKAIGGDLSKRSRRAVEQRHGHIRGGRLAEAEVGVEGAATLVGVVAVNPAVLLPAAGSELDTGTDELGVADAGEREMQPVVLAGAVQAGVPVDLALVPGDVEGNAGVVGIGGEEQIQQTVVVEVVGFTGDPAAVQAAEGGDRKRVV